MEPTLAELIAAAHDPDPDERLWAAENLSLTMDDDDPAGVDELIALSADPDRETRDWATFSLARLVGQDGPGVRAALWARLDDEDEIVRSYALHGLARRRDRRAWPLMIAALRGDQVKEHLFVAAAYLREPELAPLLREFEDETGDIAIALTECDPELRAARDALVLRVIDLLFARAPEFEPTVWCDRLDLDVYVSGSTYKPGHVGEIVSVLRSVGDDPELAAEKFIAAFRVTEV